MTSPALLALTSPQEVPAAAALRLSASGSELIADSLSSRAGIYSGWLNQSGLMAVSASTLLPLLIDGTATEAEVAALINVERIAKANINLFAELASRSTRRTMIDAMNWSHLYRLIYSDVALTRREFAPNASTGLSMLTAQATAPIRILPGAEPALVALTQDQYLVGQGYDLEGFTTLLLKWVVVA